MFGRRIDFKRSRNDEVSLIREVPALNPRSESTSTRGGDSLMGRGLTEDFGNLVLEHSGLPTSSVPESSDSNSESGFQGEIGKISPKDNSSPEKIGKV